MFMKKAKVKGFLKKNRRVVCPYCGSEEYTILNRNKLFTLRNNHSKGVCKHCGKNFRIN